MLTRGASRSRNKKWGCFPSPALMRRLCQRFLALKGACGGNAWLTPAVPKALMMCFVRGVCPVVVVYVVCVDEGEAVLLNPVEKRKR